MHSRVPQNVSAWFVESGIVTTMGLPPKDPDDDENEEDEDQEDEEEPAVIREPDE